MRAAILGAGAIAYGYAAALCQSGHEAVLWSPSGESTKLLAKGAGLHSIGAIEGTFFPTIAESCESALLAADAVVIAVPAYGHRQVIEAAAPHMRDDQVVIFSSHLSMAARYLADLLKVRSVRTSIVALGTTITTGRRLSPDTVRIGTIRKRVDAAVIPQDDADRALALCVELFGDRFERSASIVAATLSNVNPQNHLALALCNLTRMELGEAWEQNRHLTPAVARLIEALDLERIATASAYGAEVRTVQMHFHLSFGVPLRHLADMANVLAERGGGAHGPTTLDTRYVTEDLPYGIVPIVQLASAKGVDVPLHRAGLDLMSAIYGRNFESENDILPLVSRIHLDGV
ncbi:NAD/NADP octopine/nopaline dehydrogenase [Nostoc sp. 3335mG]|nr:NAD/NADP octopine/nopaline dehydrogenase [Nostoc sp. 3335mG]